MRQEILWIDDNSDRKAMSSHLERLTGIHVDFVCVDGVKLNEWLADTLQAEEPSCVLIDHVLNKAAKSELHIEKGSTVAAMMRERWIACPIIGVTAALNLKDIDIERLAYDDLVNYDEFGAFALYLGSVIEGFKKLGNVLECSVFSLLLDSPECEREVIYSCMPEDLKSEPLKKNFASRAYHWVRTVFYLRPGFLYDRDWLATLIGVRKEAVEKYLPRLEAAQYSGIFGDPSNVRWWKAKLYELIQASGVVGVSERLLQDVANEWLNVLTDERSVCYCCGGELPETMAYTDESDGAGYEQMHLECTTAHSKFRFRPGFEEVRVMMEEA
jgi:hypothetical protein